MENIQSQSRQNRYHGPITSLTHSAMDNDIPALKTCEPQADALITFMLQVADNRDRAAFGHLFQYFMPKIRAFGLQRLHEQAAVWTIYHAIDAELHDPFTGWQALNYIEH